MYIVVRYLVGLGRVWFVVVGSVDFIFRVVGVTEGLRVGVCLVVLVVLDFIVAGMKGLD